MLAFFLNLKVWGVVTPNEQTIHEERALELIKNNITFDKDYWIATYYPWKKSPYVLPNNHDDALKTWERTERQLSRDHQWKEVYTRYVICDMLDCKVARQLTSKEMFSYKVPVYYIAHHTVLNPESKTAPIWGGSITFTVNKVYGIIKNLMEFSIHLGF